MLGQAEIMVLRRLRQGPQPLGALGNGWIILQLLERGLARRVERARVGGHDRIALTGSGAAELMRSEVMGLGDEVRK
jgi:hypothetical protein